MKNKKLYLIIAAVLAVLIAVWYFFLRKKSTGESSGTGTSNTGGQTSGNSLGNAEFPLQRGSKGIEVLYYQGYLNAVKGAGITMLDGIWGNETARESFESNKGATSISKAAYDFFMPAYLSQVKSYLKSKGINV